MMDATEDGLRGLFDQAHDDLLLPADDSHADAWNEALFAMVERLSVLAMVRSEPDSGLRERVRTEFLYRLRTTAAHYKALGKYGDEAVPGWLEHEADAATTRVLAVVRSAIPAPGQVSAERAALDVSAARLVMTSKGSPQWRDGFAAGVAALAQAQDDAYRAVTDTTDGGA